MSARRVFTASVAVAALAALTLVPVSAVQAKPGKPVKSTPPATTECLNWKKQGLDPTYCVVSRKKAHVWATFVNNSDREIRLTSLSGLDLKLSRDSVLPPGKTVWLVGNASKGIDVLADVSWCPTKKYTVKCEGELTAKLSWKNPWVGYPWMKVQADSHPFATRESYTFEEAYGHAGKKGVAKFSTMRMDDYSGGAKVYRVGFAFAVR